MVSVGGAEREARLIVGLGLTETSNRITENLIIVSQRDQPYYLLTIGLYMISECRE